MDLEKARKIERQVQRWDKFAKLAPTLFLVVCFILLFTENADFDVIFLIGMIGFGLTSVVWWFWTLFSITYLVRTFYKAAEELETTGKELREIRKELNGAINRGKRD